MSSSFGLSKSNICKNTRTREEILRLLVQYRSLTTNQIFSLLRTGGNSKTLRHVQADLKTMKLAGLVQSFPISPKKGSISQFGWILLRPGARWIGLELQYGNHYRRKPSPDRIEYTGLKIRFEHALNKLPGWELERPQTYVRMQPLPDRSPQHTRLAEALTWKEFFASGRWPAGGSKGAHTLGTPLQANDYVAFTLPRTVPGSGPGPGPAIPTRMVNKRDKEAPTPPEPSPGTLTQEASNQGLERQEVEAYTEQAVVFILCPPKASEKFWQARIFEYQQIAGKLLVVGVFENEEKALSHKGLLLKGGLRVTTLSRVRMVLEGIWKPQ